MEILAQNDKSLHEQMKERIANEYRQKGYCVFTEKQIGKRRVDIYAENNKEALIIEIVDTHYAGVLDGKILAQIKVVVSRKKTSISLDPDLAEWIQQEIKKKRFVSTTHVIEYALQKLKES